MINPYLRRKFRINKRIVNIKYGRTIYGRDLEFMGQKHSRVVLVYTNCYDSKKFGVRLQEYHPKIPFSCSCSHRWVGGNCVGFNFTYKQARKIAIDFITKNKVYGEKR